MQLSLKVLLAPMGPALFVFLTHRVGRESGMNDFKDLEERCNFRQPVLRSFLRFFSSLPFLPFSLSLFAFSFRVFCSFYLSFWHIYSSFLSSPPSPLSSDPSSFTLVVPSSSRSLPLQLLSLSPALSLFFVSWKNGRKRRENRGSRSLTVTFLLFQTVTAVDFPRFLPWTTFSPPFQSVLSGLHSPTLSLHHNLPHPPYSLQIGRTRYNILTLTCTLLKWRREREKRSKEWIGSTHHLSPWCSTISERHFPH